MHALLNDFRYAWRQLRRSPVFTLTAVLTLGLGLGATATMWSVVETVLLAPAPFPHAGELAALSFTAPGDKPSAEQIGESADFLQRNSRSFRTTGIAEDANTDANLSTPGKDARPMQVHMRWISAGYLPTLGVAPSLGRVFTPEEDRSDAAKVVLLSDSIWRTQFAANSSIVGRTIHVDEQPFTVIGVMPAGFRDPSTDEATQIWEPLALSPAQPGYDGDNYIMAGRLKPGVSLAAAQSELNALTAPFLHDHPHYLYWTMPGSPRLAYHAWPLAEALTSNVQASLLTILGAVMLVLLLACLNLAGLFGTRIAERRGELQLRAALGAGRLQLLRLLTSEAALLALAAAAVAGAFSAMARPALLAGSPVPLPVLGAAGAWQQVFVTLLVSLAASLVFAGLPAAFALRRRFAVPGRGAVGSDRAQSRLGAGLVVAQVCFATVLLTAASLLLGIFLHLQSTSPGFSPRHLVAAQLALHGDRYNSSEAKSRFIDQVINRLEQTSGVSSAAAIDGLPLRRGLNIGMKPDRTTNLPNNATELRPVSPGFFSIMGLHLVRGRLLLPTDTAHTLPAAVISETTARLWFPGQDPLGRQVRFAGDEPLPMQVVGVISDTHTNSVAEPFLITVYAPYSQLPDGITRIVNRWIGTSFVLRAADGVPVARIINDAVHAADAEMPVADISTLTSILRENNAAPRFFSSLATAFAAFALLLTSLGLFGLLSYQVVQRTRELGLRMAVGATRGTILLSILRRGLLLTSIGLTLGLAASLALPKLVAGLVAESIRTGSAPASSLLAHSYLATALSALTLLLAAVFACSVPAWRASHIDPMEALRTE